jgi:hypothetical protein
VLPEPQEEEVPLEELPIELRKQLPAPIRQRTEQHVAGQLPEGVKEVIEHGKAEQGSDPDSSGPGGENGN